MSKQLEISYIEKKKGLKELKAAMAGHAIARTELVGTYKKSR